MKAVAVVLGSVVLIASTGASVAKTPFAEPHLAISTSRDSSAGRTLLAESQLPTIDRNVSAHDTASATRANGHFYFETEVNGVSVPMVFDTGASSVLLRAEDAQRAGINPSTLNYSINTTTANGPTAVAPVVIKVMKVGGITRTNVMAAVAKPGALTITLLGQTFMATLAGFSTEGDRLVLHGN